MEEMVVADVEVADVMTVVVVAAAVVANVSEKC